MEISWFGDSFEALLNSLKDAFRHDSFTCAETAASFCRAVNDHFADVDGECCGVYVVRQDDTGDVLYIGKGGTVETCGQFKQQDVPGRLQAPRGSHKADEWFGELMREKGVLRVEYLVVKRPFAPAFVEAALLQAYWAEWDHLPPRNRAF